jgi:ATP-dependent Clp protease protease subunit
MTPNNDFDPGFLLQKKGVYVLMSDIDHHNVKPVIEWILYENFAVKKKKPELQLIVCSNGGDTSAAFALIDIMRSSTIPIKTVGLGVIASAGLLVFIAGTQGKRVLTPNTSILSHQFSWWSEGKVHELIAQVKEYQLLHRRMVEHYKLCTNLALDKIKEKLLPPEDVYLDSQEALNLNLCDYIAEFVEQSFSTASNR